MRRSGVDGRDQAGRFFRMLEDLDKMILGAGYD